MAIWRGAGGPGDATTDAANEASVASTKAAEAEASATAAASSATSAANSATTATNSKDAAVTSESNAATSAVTATTQASNAATSASAASTSATAAQTAQTAAEAAKTAAETAETGAEVAKTAAQSAQTAAEQAQTGAETAETNAETAQTAAETALASTLSTLDEFDDTYLGAKSADPTVDNDNDPLTTGALYFNTTSNDMKVYNGSAWEVTFATLSGALLAANNLSDVVDANAAKTNLGLGTTDSPTFVNVTATGNITVSGTVDGRDVATDGTKLDGIEASATADQTAGEIKTAYESNADTNAFTDADHTKLDGIEALADVTDATNVTAAGALMDSELTSEASVKALNQGVATTDSPSFAGLTVDTNTLYVDSTNNRVGIGTTSPTLSKLHIDGGDLRIQDVTPNIYFYSEGAVNNVQINANISDAAQGGIAIYENSNALIKSRTNYTQFYSANTERMRITSTGNVGIGTSSPSQKLHVVGNIKGSQSITIGTSGLYEAGSIYSDVNWGMLFRAKQASPVQANFRWANSADAELMRIDSSGNVGIGTSSPTEKLDVDGNINFGASNVGRIYSTDGTRGSIQISAPHDATNRSVTYGNNYYLDSDGTYKQATINIGGSALEMTATNNSYGEFVFRQKQDQDAGGAERVATIINADGNVGIGTTSPAAQLDVVGTVRLTNTANASNNSNIRDGGGLVVEAGNNNPLYFYTGGSEKVRITSAGNVGIGTTSPVGKLDVAGEIIAMSGSGTADRHIEIGVGRTGNGNSYIDLISDTTYTDYGARLIRYNTGANAATRLDHRGTGELSMWASDAGILKFGTGNTERMRITSSGNVGIGLTNPLYPLNVSTTSGTIARFASTTNTAAFEINSPIANYIALKAMSTDGLILSTNNTEAMRLDISGNLKFNSGYGSVATAYGCRAWVNFNGTGTVAIRDSGNVSSITDSGTGNYTVNFTTAMPDVNYSAVCSGFRSAGNEAVVVPDSFVTGGVGVNCTNGGGAEIDFSKVCVAVFR